MEIRYVRKEDKEFWYQLDKHLPETEFEKKVRDKQGYVICEDGNPVGILRYNLFWDIPGYEQPMEIIMSKAL